MASKAKASRAGLWKYNQFHDEPGSTHNLVVGLVPTGSRVLEIGSATGYMSEVLRTRLGCTVTAIEVSEAAAELARERCDRLVVGDAETIDLDEALGDELFDVVLFADVLEHLKEPGAVLRRVRPYLAAGGAVIASLPNVAHGSIRLALLRGEFRYRPVGLLDETHLRFYTYEGLRDLFESSGYVLTIVERKRLGLDETEIKNPPPPEVVMRLLEADPEATTYQFIVRAEPSETTAPLRDEIRELREEVHRLTSQLAAALDEVERYKAATEAQPVVDESE